MGILRVAKYEWMDKVCLLKSPSASSEIQAALYCTFINVDQGMFNYGAC